MYSVIAVIYQSDASLHTNGHMLLCHNGMINSDVYM